MISLIENWRMIFFLSLFLSTKGRKKDNQWHETISLDSVSRVTKKKKKRRERENSYIFSGFTTLTLFLRHRFDIRRSPMATKFLTIPIASSNATHQMENSINFLFFSNKIDVMIELNLFPMLLFIDHFSHLPLLL